MLNKDQSHNDWEEEKAITDILYAKMSQPSFRRIKSSIAVVEHFFSFIRLVYGDTWAGKGNGVINLAAENKMRELSSAT